MASVINSVGSLAVIVSIVDEVINAITETYGGSGGSEVHPGDKCSCDRCVYSIEKIYKRVLRWHSLFVLHMGLLAAMGCGVIYLCNTANSYTTESTSGVSGTTVNVFGAATANVVNGPSNDWELWDATDAAVPALENVVFFITTKIVKTTQTRGICPERREVDGASCEAIGYCPKSTILDMGSGVTTGTCDNGTCSVDAWCPTEYDAMHKDAEAEILNGTGNFIVLIKNHVYFEFPDGEHKGYNNIYESPLTGNGVPCIHDAGNSQDLCPYFRVHDMAMAATTEEGTAFNDLINDGGVISIRTRWNCFFPQNCTPTYHFRRLDNSSPNAVARGYNYSDTVHSETRNKTRTFIRRSGILFIIETNAVSSRFSASRLITSLGAIFGLTRVAKAIKHLLAGLFSFCCGCGFCICTREPRDQEETVCCGGCCVCRHKEKHLAEDVRKSDCLNEKCCRCGAGSHPSPATSGRNRSYIAEVHAVTPQKMEADKSPESGKKPPKGILKKERIRKDPKGNLGSGTAGKHTHGMGRRGY